MKEWEVNAKKKEDLVKMVMEMQSQMQSGEIEMPDEVDLSMVVDPFDVQNPHKFKAHPPGFRLNWLNPNYRNPTGKWKGWVPVEYDDEIGQNLHKYLHDPPHRMKGVAELDSYVRRGVDSILCKLPIEYYLLRKRRKEEKAANARNRVVNAENTQIRPGVMTTGEGLQVEERPAGGFRAREERPPEEAPGQRTELFSENREESSQSEE